MYPFQDAELDTPTHMTLDSLTSHAESTSSTFLYLQLSLLSLSASSALSHAASHLGVAQGITTLLRALPYHASQGRMVIPAEITARHGVSQEEVFRRGGQAKGIDDAVFEFATAANDNLQTCMQILKSERVPGRAKAVFLNAVCRTSTCTSRIAAGICTSTYQLPTTIGAVSNKPSSL